MKDEQMTKKEAQEAIIAFLKKARFLRLTNDVAFKAFFKRNKKLLISLLNSFLPLEESKILDVELVDTHHHPESLESDKDITGKQFVLDLKVKMEVITESGEKQIETANVEIQTTSEPRMPLYSVKIEGL